MVAIVNTTRDHVYRQKIGVVIIQHALNMVGNIIVHVKMDLLGFIVRLILMIVSIIYVRMVVVA
jgi:hypothetical protein